MLAADWVVCILCVRVSDCECVFLPQFNRCTLHGLRSCVLIDIAFSISAIMRTKALINHFHDLQPIYSAHFEPGSKGRLATAGGDNNVRVSSPPHPQGIPTSVFSSTIDTTCDRYGRFTIYLMEKSRWSISQHCRGILKP